MNGAIKSNQQQIEDKNTILQNQNLEKASILIAF